MPYCSRCGVEVDEYVTDCPLCKSKIQLLDNTPDLPGNFPDDNIKSDDYYIPFENKKKIFWSVFSFINVTALFIVFSVNFLLNRTITWGWIPLFSLLLFWGLAACIYYFYEKIYFLLLSFYFILLIYLYLLFFIIQNINLFFNLAMPILSAAFINLALVVFLVRITKKRGYNIIGFILTGTAFLCAAVDITVKYFMTSKIIMTWSIVVISLLLPIVLFLFYIHYVRKKVPDIKKIFHI